MQCFMKNFGICVGNIFKPDTYKFPVIFRLYSVFPSLWTMVLPAELIPTDIKSNDYFHQCHKI